MSTDIAIKTNIRIHAERYANSIETVERKRDFSFFSTATQKINLKVTLFIGVGTNFPS